LCDVGSVAGGRLNWMIAHEETCPTRLKMKKDRRKKALHLLLVLLVLMPFPGAYNQ